MERAVVGMMVEVATEAVGWVEVEVERLVASVAARQ